MIVFNSNLLKKFCKKIDPYNWEDLKSAVVEKMIINKEKINIKTDLQYYACFMARNMFLNANRNKLDLVRIDTLILKYAATEPYFDFEENTLTILENKIESDKCNKKRFYHSMVMSGIVYFDFSIKQYSEKSKIPMSEVYRVYNEYLLYLKDFLLLEK